TATAALLVRFRPQRRKRERRRGFTRQRLSGWRILRSSDRPGHSAWRRRARSGIADEWEHGESSITPRAVISDERCYGEHFKISDNAQCVAEVECTSSSCQRRPFRRKSKRISSLL